MAYASCSFFIFHFFYFHYASELYSPDSKSGFKMQLTASSDLCVRRESEVRFAGVHPRSRSGLRRHIANRRLPFDIRLVGGVTRRACGAHYPQQEIL